MIDKYGFPISKNDIGKCKLTIRKINDEYYEDDNKALFTQKLKNEFLDFTYKLISPITNINIDFIWDMAIDNQVYLEYLEKSRMDIEILNNIFIHELYIKISKQPKMSLFSCFMEDTKLILFFSNKRISLSKIFEWKYEPEIFKPNHEISNYIKFFKNNKTFNPDSSKEKGDKYEMFCQNWLNSHGYKNIESTGQKGDKGIDIIALNPNNKVVGIQCKYKKSGQNSSQDIRLLNLYTIQLYYPQINETMMITNCPISRDAVNDLEKLNVIYIILPYVPEKVFYSSFD